MNVLAERRDDFRFYRSIKPRQSFVGLALDRLFWVSVNYRFRHWACYLEVPFFGRCLRFVSVLINLVVSSVTGTDIHPRAVIGRRFHVHTSFGIVIADGVIIGDDCTINTGVGLINKANAQREGVPRLGNHVTLSAGCKLMGGITVGDFAVVGANSVVIRDVPFHHMALGVPAMNVPIAERLNAESATQIAAD